MRIITSLIMFETKIWKYVRERGYFKFPWRDKFRMGVIKEGSRLSRFETGFNSIKSSLKTSCGATSERKAC